MIQAVKENKLNAYTFQKLRREKGMKEIAKMFGYKSVNSLYYWCYRNNVETKRVTNWEVAEDIGEMTVKEIAYKYNVSIFAVYHRLSKMGICTKQ
jgi:transposase